MFQTLHYAHLYARNLLQFSCPEKWNLWAYHQLPTLRSTNIAGWKMDHVKMYFLLNIRIFHGHGSLPKNTPRKLT